jgi:hypothetical protein
MTFYICSANGIEIGQNFLDFVNCWPKFAQVKIATFMMFTDSPQNYNVNVG